MDDNWNPDDAATGLAALREAFDAAWEEREQARREGRFFTVTPTTEDPHDLIAAQVQQDAMNHLMATNPGFVAKWERQEAAIAKGLRDLMLYGHATVRLEP